MSLSSAIESLNASDGVAFAEPNYLRKLLYTPSDPDFPIQWGLHNTGQTIGGVPGTPDADIDAPEAWDVEKGSNSTVYVAVIDSGIDLNHPDLDGRIRVNTYEIPGNNKDDEGNGYVDDVNGYNFAGISQYRYYYYVGSTIYYTFWYFGRYTITQMLAQSFTARASSGHKQKLTHLGIMLSKIGNPTSTITVSVRSSLSGSDLASFTISPGEVISREVYKRFSKELYLTPGSTYYFVFRTDSVDSSNYYHLGHNAGSVSENYHTYHEGTEWQWNGSDWVEWPKDDFYFRTNPYFYPHDNNGHGTHCAGIIAAENNNAGCVGVTLGNNVKIMPIKVGDSSGWLRDDHILESIYYAADNGAKVISMSFGGSVYSSAEQDAVNYAYNKGAILFASAGNSGDSTMRYPAGYANVVGVGATTNKDEKVTFSTYNSSVDLSAPGKDVYSTMPTYPVCGNDLGYTQNYSYMSGTSMACPMAAGLAALIRSRNRSWTAAQVQTAMQNNADDLGTPGRDDYFGYGRINAKRTIDTVPLLPVPAISTINPTMGYVRSEVTISGKNFGSTRGSSYVKFGTKKVTAYVSWSSTKIKVKVPDGVSGEVPVKVYTLAGGSNSKVFSVKPKINAISPISGSIGSYVTISGRGYGSLRGTSYVTFGSKRVSTYSSWTDTKLKVKVPSGIPKGKTTTKVTTSGGEKPQSNNGKDVSHGITTEDAIAEHNPHKQSTKHM